MPYLRTYCEVTRLAAIAQILISSQHPDWMEIGQCYFQPSILQESILERFLIQTKNHLEQPISFHYTHVIG